MTRITQGSTVRTFLNNHRRKGVRVESEMFRPFGSWHQIQNIFRRVVTFISRHNFELWLTHSCSFFDKRCRLKDRSISRN